VVHASVPGPRDQLDSLIQAAQGGPGKQPLANPGLYFIREDVGKFHLTGPRPHRDLQCWPTRHTAIVIHLARTRDCSISKRPAYQKLLEEFPQPSASGPDLRRPRMGGRHFFAAASQHLPTKGRARWNSCLDTLLSGNFFLHGV